MAADRPVLPLCIVGASPRSGLYVQALRRICAGVHPVELRVTCLCDGSPELRQRLCAALCQAGGSDEADGRAVAHREAIEELEDFDEVVVLEEFGDFLCSAVIILLEDVSSRVAVAMRALAAKKHVLMEPWTPAPATARRWGGIDDSIRRLWDCMLAGDGSAICEFAHPLAAAARRFGAWLEAEGQQLEGAVASAFVLQPARPDAAALQTAVGTAGPEQVAWLRLLREWLTPGGTQAGMQDSEPPALRVTAGPGVGSCSLVLAEAEKASAGAPAAAATVSWAQAGSEQEEDGPAGGLHCRCSLAGPRCTATLAVRGLLRPGAGAPGVVDGAALACGAKGPHTVAHFALGEVESIAAEILRFADRVVAMQEGSAIAGVVGAAPGLEVGDRAAYAELLALSCGGGG